MQFPDGNQPLEHIRGGIGVGLMQHPLVACTGGAGLVGIHPGNHQNPISYLLLKRPQPVHIVHHAGLLVSRARTDDQNNAVIFTGEDFF